MSQAQKRPAVCAPDNSLKGELHEKLNQKNERDNLNELNNKSIYYKMNPEPIKDIDITFEIVDEI